MVRTFEPIDPPKRRPDDNKEVRKSWHRGTKIQYLTENSGRWVEGVIVKREQERSDPEEIWLDVHIPEKNQVEEVFAFDDCIRPFTERFPITHTFAQVKEKYEIIDKIGYGTTALVRKVKRRSDGKLFAMKQIKKKRLDLDEQEQVEKEITFLLKANHPSIVKIEEYFTTKSFICVILDYLAGGHLFDAIAKKGTFSEFEAATIMKQILSALSYMHSSGYCHRDIKPLNLMLNEDIDVSLNTTLIDFGFIGHKDVGMSTQLGSPEYIAPEIALSMEYDTKVDTWSAGIVLFMLLFGEVPFPHRGSIPDTMKAIVSRPLHFPKSSHSDKALAVLRRMLEKDPATRPSCLEVLDMEWFHEASPLFLADSKKHQMLACRMKLRRGVHVVMSLMKLMDSGDLSEQEKRDSRIITKKQMQNALSLQAITSNRL